MAFRMKRSLPNDNKPEPMRKRRKLNTLFDIDDVDKLSKKAEISISKSLTADEKRIEIAKRLLAAAKEKVVDESDIENDDDDDLDEDDILTSSKKDVLIHKQLMKQIGQKEGSYRYRMAIKLKQYIDINNRTNSVDFDVASFRGHRLSVTCMTLDPSGNDKYIITGSKDGSIIKWDLLTGKKIKKIWHAWPINNRNAVNKKTGKKLKWGGLRREYVKKIRPKPVLALAISPDSKWLVSGGEDCLIRIWNAKTLRFKSTFRGGHKAKITGLAFSKENIHKTENNEIISNNTLFSTGYDRQIRVYDMNEMGFAEPLYGHSLGINTIDTTTDDRCLTVSDDKSIRYWKLRTQSQLIFNNGHDLSIDACSIITQNQFITGSQDGSIALWSTKKKYPLHKEIDAHLTKNKYDTKHNSKLKHWITALGSKHNSDIFASGSSDGIIKLWSIKNESFTHLRSIKIPKGGFINVIKFTQKGDKIICGIGTEHRLGRWQTVKGAKNGICIIKLPINVDEDDDDNKKNNNDNKEEEEEEEEEKDKIKYQKSENWDKWNPKEKGDEAIDSDMKNNKIKNKNNNNDNNKDKDTTNDEWTSFFGNVF